MMIALATDRGPVATTGVRLRIRFLSAGDPTRAFIAEAFARQQVATSVEVVAEGDPAHVHPAGRQVMAEVRLPLPGFGSPKRADGAPELTIVIRDRGLPTPQIDLPSPDVVSWSFDNPAATSEGAKIVAGFRRVRDEIKRRVDLLVLVKQLGRARPRLATG